MALKDILSGLRMLILEPERFSDAAKRSAALIEALPGLSLAEADDLGKLPSDRLAIYTTSIFTGQGKLIQKFMPKTFAILKSSWPQIFHETFSGKTLALTISNSFPWRSFETTELLLNCRNFIESCDKFPSELDAIAQHEAAVFRVKRAANNRYLPLTAAECSALTVEEFLMLRLKAHPGAEWLTLKFNVLKNYEPGDYGYVVCRDLNDNHTRTAPVPAALAEFVLKNSEFTVESLTEFVVKSSEPQPAFLELSSQVFKLCGLGALCVASLESAPDARFYPH